MTSAFDVCNSMYAEFSKVKLELEIKFMDYEHNVHKRNSISRSSGEIMKVLSEHTANTHKFKDIDMPILQSGYDLFVSKLKDLYSKQKSCDGLLKNSIWHYRVGLHNVTNMPLRLLIGALALFGVERAVRKPDAAA